MSTPQDSLKSLRFDYSKPRRSAAGTTSLAPSASPTHAPAMQAVWAEAARQSRDYYLNLGETIDAELRRRLTSGR